MFICVYRLELLFTFFTAIKNVSVVSLNRVVIHLVCFTILRIIYSKIEKILKNSREQL